MTTKSCISVLLALLLAPCLVHAEDEDSLTKRAIAKTEVATENAIDYAGRIVEEGDNVLYLSGYAHHNRATYSPEKIAEFNETAWGAGFGRTLIDGNGNSNALFGLAFLDSHSDVQLQAGYAREWRWQFAERAAVGAGFVAMLVSRSDIFHGFPFPAILPLASVEVGPVALMASYVPKLSSSDGGNGNVLYLFGRINLGR
ncbi:MAG TPA: hypothetical protein VF460_01715 [Burkholderiales bacterium]